MNYLLDTNVCMALINGRKPGVRSRFAAAVESGAVIAVPSIVNFELWYGVAKSERVIANSDRLHAFFSGPLELLPLDDSDAQAAGRIRAELESAGTPIGAYDLLLAGQAIHRGMTVVTSNTREFGRVTGLSWEDWG